MATYAGQYDKSHNVDFVNRVEQAIVSAAITISAEADTVANHANRIAWANQVLRNPQHSSQIMAVGLVTDAALQSTQTDPAILAAANAQWNAYAGLGTTP